MLLYVVFSLLGSAFSQFLDNENITTSKTTLHNEIVYVNPLSEKTKIIIIFLVFACTVSVPMIIIISCLNKLIIRQERAVLPFYEDNEYSNNTINIGFEGVDLAPPRYRIEN